MASNTETITYPTNAVFSQVVINTPMADGISYVNIVISIIALIFFGLSIYKFISINNKPRKPGMRAAIILLLIGIILLAIPVGLKGHDNYTKANMKAVTLYGFVVYQE